MRYKNQRNANLSSLHWNKETVMTVFVMIACLRILSLCIGPFQFSSNSNEISIVKASRLEHEKASRLEHELNEYSSHIRRLNQIYHEEKLIVKLQDKIKVKQKRLNALDKQQTLMELKKKNEPTRTNLNIQSRPRSISQTIQGHQKSQTIQGHQKQPPKENNNPINPIFAIGERNSGTNMLYNALRDCYGDNNVMDKFARDKHWLQDEYVFKSERTIKRKILDIYKSRKYTIFISVRGVFNWVAAMNARPYEMPAHAVSQVRDNMTRFILHPWAMKRPKNDIKKKDCQGNFPSPEYVVPCIDYRGIYELNSFNGGKPYKNILDFRAAKMRNYLNMTTWNPKVVFIKLEEYYRRPREVLKKIEEAVGAKCKITKSFEIDFKKTKVNKMSMRVDPLFTYKSKKLSNGNYDISKSNINLIKILTDWKVEKAIGYRMIDLVPQL
jgi:hypothetical protein